MNLERRSRVACPVAAALVVLCPCIGVLAETAGQAPAVSLTVGAGVGMISYEEDFTFFTSTESEWEAAMAMLSVALRIEDGSGWVLQGQGRLMQSDEDTEEWQEYGFLVQENDMEVMSAEFLGEVGYNVYNANNTRVTPLLGIGARYLEFERTNPEIPGGLAAGWTTAEEDVDVGLVNLALELEHSGSENVSVHGRFDLGLVTFSEADNSVVPGTMEGDGGVIVGVEGGLTWQLSDHHSFLFAAKYELQRLEGDTDHTVALDDEGQLVDYDVEWPDNETARFWLEARWEYLF